MDTFINFIEQHEKVGGGLIALVVIILTYIVSRLVPIVQKAISRHITGRTKTELDDQLIRLIGRSLRRLIWLAGFFFVLQYLSVLFSEDLQSKLKAYTGGLFYVILVFIIAHFVSRILQTLLDWYSQKWGKNVRGRVQDEFGPLFRRLIVIVVYSIAVVFILKHLKQDISSIIVSLGVGSLAVALAAKDTLANMIAGFMIMTDRPFRVGDRILLESGEKGDVYDIGLRSTKILTFDNTLIVVPNQQIINEKVTNLSYPDPQIRVLVEVGVAYGTDLDKAKALLEKACESHADVLSDPPPKAYFLNFGASSLDLRVVCRVGKWSEQWRVAEELRMEINRVFEKEKIEIPFPQRVVTMKDNKQDDV